MAMPALTLPESVLGLFLSNGEVSVEKTCEFLEISKKQLAAAFGVSENVIRPERMSQVTKDRFYKLAEAIERAALLLEKDANKTKLWFRLPNPNLGDISPRSLIIAKRSEVVLNFIDSARQGY